MKTSRVYSIVINDCDDFQNPLLGAGQAHATLEVGKRLARRGHTVKVISSKYPGSVDRIDNGITYTHIGIASPYMRLNIVVYILLLPFVVSRLRADIIVDCFTSPVSALCSQLFTRIPVVGLPTSFEAGEFSRKYHLPFWIAEAIGAKSYRYFLPYTRYYADKMRALNPAVHQRIVSEGVGPEYFAIKRKRPSHVLYLGRLDIDQKGIDLLLTSWANIYQKIGLPLIIAGHGPDERRIRLLVQRMGLSSSVRFVGGAYGSKKKRLLASAAFVIFPSRHEGFSLFALEALAAGCPLVGFNIPGLSWARTRAVKKVPPFDTAKLSQAILRISKQDAAELSEQARSYAHKFTWDAVTDKWIEFFESIEKEHYDQLGQAYI